MSKTISKQNLDFLKKIKNNNNREWFTENKDIYEEALGNAKAFANSLSEEMQKIDNIEKLKLYRIYRDVRFSKDKTPYKSSWSGSLSRATKQLRGGYFFSIAPGDTMIGGGFYKPSPADLKLIRNKIAADDKPFGKVLNAKKFKDTFGELMGDQVKTSPKGFDKEHPAIDLLRYKSFYVFKSFTDKEVKSVDFFKETIKTWKIIRPFFDLMSDVLTTDMNGVPLYE